MATTAQNNQKQNDTDTLFFPVDTTGSNDVNGGDLVYFDGSAYFAKSLSNSDANANTFIGVASQSSFLQVYATKSYPTGGITVFTRGLFLFNTTGSDTMHHGDAVYSGADAQTITSTGGTHKVGYCWFRPGAGTSLTGGAAGTAPTIEILITPLFPVLGGL